MNVTRISLEEHADLFDAMTGIESDKEGVALIHQGNHPEHGRIMLIQPGAVDEALMIRC